MTPTQTGMILGVTPRITPDGMVVMEIDANKSEVGPESEGIPIFVSTGGQVVRQPRIDITLAQTTVAAPDGQTVVLGGLIRRTPPMSGAECPTWGTFPFRPAVPL